MAKMRNRILALALPLTLAPLALTALAVNYFVVRNYQVQIEGEESGLLTEALVDIRREQENARKDVALIAHLSPVAEYLEAISPASQITNSKSSQSIEVKEAAARTSIQLFFERNPYYFQLDLVDAQGQERVKLTKLPGANALKPIDKDLFRRMLISGGGSTDLQMPVQAVQSIPFASVFTSIVRREKFAGVVVLYLNTTVFERVLRPLLASHQLSSVLFDDRGLVFAKAIGGLDEENLLSHINLSTEAMHLLAGQTLVESSREVTGTDRSYVFTLLPAGTLIANSSLEPEPGENWFLGVLRSKETLRGKLSAFQITFFLLLIGAFAAAIWTTRHYSRRFTEPLEQITKAATKIAHGEFDIGFDIETGDEVEELASAVKQMTTDLKQYQAELVKAAKLVAIGEMAAEVSHEIQNRISGLSLWIQYLDSEISPDDPKREYLREMKLGLEGFLKLLVDLKQFYRTPILQKSNCDLNDLARESLRFIDREARDRNITLETQFASKLPPIHCDGEKIKSVIINLLINAIEANGNRVRLSTGFVEPNQRDGQPAPGRKKVALSVEDNGNGIAEEDISRVFYPFHSTKPGGSGLGLAIASNLVKAHGGRIEVESYIGQGTRFTIMLDVPGAAGGVD